MITKWKQIRKDFWGKKEKYGNSTIAIIKKSPSTVYEYIRKFDGVTQAYKTFKIKVKATDYAKNYMKNH